MRRLLIASLVALCISAGLVAQGGIGPIGMLQGKVDANNALVVSSVAIGSTSAQGSPIANLPGKVDANNALVVALGGGVATFNIDGIAAGPATAPNAAITCANNTAATVGTVAQWSPGCPLWTASGWDTDDAVARTTHGYLTLRPVTGATVTSQLQLMMEVSPFSGSYNQALTITQGGQGTFLGSVVSGASNGFIVLNKSAMTSPADQEMNFTNNGASINAGIRYQNVVEANTGAKSPSALENAELYTNTGDADGSSVTLLNDPTVGSTVSVAVTAAFALTVAAGSGETLKYGSSTCGTSLVSSTVGSTATFVAATGGSGAIWVTTSSLGVWVCTP